MITESEKHTPPHADNLEKSVLSNLFNSDHLDGEETLTSEHFWNPCHRAIYELIALKQRPIDITLLSQELLSSGKMEQIGGVSKIAEIFTYSPTTAYFQSHLKELHVFKARRFAIKAAYDLADLACDQTDSDGFIDAAGQPMVDIGDIASNAYRSRDKKLVLKELLDDVTSRLKGNQAAMGWATGISPIDNCIKGLHPKRLCIISGYPTSGKTVIAVQMLWQLAMDKIPALFISLEMPDKSIAERNLIISSGLPALAISDPFEYAKANGSNRPTKEHIMQIRSGVSLLDGKPMYFEDPPSPKIGQIVAMIRKNVRKNGVRAVGVDYLQLIKGSTKSWSKENEIAEISHTFQGLAKELNISILLLSQQNKDGGTKYAEAIAEDADSILSIVQNRDSESDDYGKHLGIGVRKDRHYGQTGAFLPVILDKIMLKFTTIATPKP